MPFKQALLQHVIRHYPAFILQAASVALTDSKTSVAPKDSGSTTFGKFTVQFKGNLVVTMVTDGLLGMLLDTLHSLLLEAARAEGGVMLEEGEDEEAAEEEADIELGSDELLGHAVSSRDEADEPADEPVALSPNGAVDVGWRLADVAGGPSEMMDVEASPLAGSASGVGGVRNLVERYEWTAAEDELTLGSVEEYGSKWTSTLVAAAAMEKAGELLEAAELVVSAKSPIVSSHLYSQVCYDVRYTLNHLPLADAFMRRGELLPLLLRCLSLCQGLYPIRRRTQMHVVREENTWADAFSLGTEMSQLFPHVVAGIAAPETDPDASAKIGLALSLPCATPARAQVAARYVAAVTHTTRSLRAWLLCHRAARLGCDGTRGLFSYHLPLHRLLATLVSFGAHTLQLPLDSLLPPCLDGAVPLKEDFILRLAKHPLRVLTLLSQTRSSYWVRNGHAASKPATLYRSPTFGELFMMPDLMLLQYCLLRLGTARFVGLGLATFALRSFLPGLVSASQPPLAYPAVDHSDRPLAPGVAPGDPTPLAEDFLTLLVMLVNERSPCASADAPPAPPSVVERTSGSSGSSGSGGSGAARAAASWRNAQVLERQLIHRLALSEHCTYSELINALPKRLTELPEFEESLHRIANFVAPTGMAQGRYVLRKEAWSRFDAFFPLYSPQDVHRAQERAARFVPSDAPLPTPPPPCAAFERLPHALSCASVHGILYAVLYAAVRRGERGSERLLCVALRLLQLALAAPPRAPPGAAASAAASAAAKAPPPPPPPPRTAAEIFGSDCVGRVIWVYGFSPCPGPPTPPPGPPTPPAGPHTKPRWRKAVVCAFDAATREHTLLYGAQYGAYAERRVVLVALLHSETWVFEGGPGAGDPRRFFAPLTRVFPPSATSIEENVRTAPILLAPAPITAPNPSLTSAMQSAPSFVAEAAPTLIQLVCQLSRDERMPTARALAQQLTASLEATSPACAAAVEAALRPQPEDVSAVPGSLGGAAPGAAGGAARAGAGGAAPRDQKEVLRRKQLAKERQAAIMQRFSKEQAAFEGVDATGTGSSAGTSAVAEPAAERPSAEPSAAEDLMEVDTAAEPAAPRLAAQVATARGEAAEAEAMMPVAAAAGQQGGALSDRDRMPPPPVPAQQGRPLATHSPLRPTRALAPTGATQATSTPTTTPPYSPQARAPTTTPPYSPQARAPTTTPPYSPQARAQALPPVTRYCALCHEMLLPESSVCGMIAFAQKAISFRAPPPGASVLPPTCEPCDDETEGGAPTKPTKPTKPRGAADDETEGGGDDVAGTTAAAAPLKGSAAWAATAELAALVAHATQAELETEMADDDELADDPAEPRAVPGAAPGGVNGGARLVDAMDDADVMGMEDGETPVEEDELEGVVAEEVDDLEEDANVVGNPMVVPPLPHPPARIAVRAAATAAAAGGDLIL